MKVSRIARKDFFHKRFSDFLKSHNDLKVSQIEDFGKLDDNLHEVQEALEISLQKYTILLPKSERSYEKIKKAQPISLRSGDLLSEF